MPPFHFKLQQILDYRAQLEEQAKLRFAQAQREHDLAEARVDSLRALVAENERKLYENVTSPNEHWLLDNYVTALKTDLVSALRNLVMLAQAREDARMLLVQRAQERKLLEKLKTKQAERHASAEKLAEQRTYDETATLRFRAPSF